MKVRWYHATIFVLALLLLGAVVLLMSVPVTDRDTLYQVSALDLLANGSYDGIATANDLKAHGDFGLGTFDGLNGELVELDGTIYQVTSDGLVHVVNGTASIPFAEVTYFDVDRNVSLTGRYNYFSLTASLDERLPSLNEFYAIRIHGTFPYLKLRSPPAQQKPYPVLSEALKNQSVFEKHNITGTIVGIYTPAYARGMGSPGYHFHFISDDRQSGGHVVDLLGDDMTVSLDETPRFEMTMAPERVSN
ncbi:MAG TPA: acetolactate decarboxylase [Methanocella sp.]|uniref:acetolactate decarboxylase n=1 Tax=Methanocella sp. TaxID=2052833 RepID=UPI002CF9D823|nr:acetolactate decarboxylase [Methanocella sp.]HTY91999.1 acetolactate decarboxylase [Methanocella sp.]